MASLDKQSELAPVSLDKQSELAPASLDKQSELVPASLDKQSELAPASLDKQSELAPASLDKQSECEPSSTVKRSKRVLGSPMRMYQDESKNWVFSYKFLEKNINIVSGLIDLIDAIGGDQSIIKNVSAEIIIKYNEIAIHKAVMMESIDGIPQYLIKKLNL
jgi:hypothetical protein